MKTNNTNTGKVVLAILGLAISGIVSAQQAPLSNFYNFNEYLMNPAEAGANNWLEGTASHRIQWQGIEGAPRTTFFGIHGMLNEKMGLGLKIDVDQTDILKQFNAAASYAYRIKLNEKARLHFGVSAMMVQNSVGYNDAVVGNLADEVVNGGSENGMNFDAETGIMLEYSKFRLGIASSNLFESAVIYALPDDRGDGTFDRVRQFRAYTSYEFDLNDKWTLEPFALVRNQGVESFQFEVNALSTWNETLYLGAGYRQEAGFIGRVGFQITEQIVAAYAYEFAGNGVASYSGGSHEFMLGLKIGKKAQKPKTAPTPAPVVEKVEEKKEVEITTPEPVKEAPKKIEKVVEKVEEVAKVEPVKEVVPTPPVVIEKPKPTLNKEVFDYKIHFDLSASEIDSETKGHLNKIAAELKAFPNQKVLIEGHTDNSGTVAQNTVVSTRRAERIKDYLVKQGVNSSQLQTKVMNDTEPLKPNNSSENRRLNRRVEIELIK